MIVPFHERGVFEGVTFGLGPAGYDIRLAEDMEIGVNEFQLAASMEQFFLPSDLLMRVVDKSSWARRGLLVQNTVAEPGWRGFLTLEITNHGDLKRVRAGTAIAQVIFDCLDEPTDRPYNGRYQNQPFGPVEAKIAREGD